jgi:formylglycine-generating enzyme required for sulfatase activity
MAFIPAGYNSGTDPTAGFYYLENTAIFYMDCSEVTKAQWDEVYAWAITNGYGFDNVGSGKATNHPVQTVNWYDCVKWCNARSEKGGRTPAYYTTSEQIEVYRAGSTNIDDSCINLSSGYRLPTDLEWEYAARGGVDSRRFPWGDSDEIQHARANYFSDPYYSYDTSPTRGYHPVYASGAQPYTSPAGSFAANGYGLYDMAGNVSEWCWNWAPGFVGTNRVSHGGSWHYYAYLCRSGLSSYDVPATAANTVGFRTVLPTGQ